MNPGERKKPLSLDAENDGMQKIRVALILLHLRYWASQITAFFTD